MLVRVIAPWITPHSTNRRARRSPYRKHAPPIAFLTQIKDARCGDGGEVFDATIEVPVTIRKPDKPIGTHVFTAMARNDAGLRWTAVTIDNGDDAKDALDRITIPQHVLDRIAPTALPRSSIIVSDEPLSRETNYRTEFVAVLNNQPQGGFLSAGLRSMSPLRGATTGATTASASFSSAIGTRNLPIRVRAPGNTINRCNSAGGNTRHAARRPHGRSGSGSSFQAQVAHYRFSNRPFGVKRFQTIHHCSVDVAHGLVLLFGIGTKALPSWDSKTRWNNLRHDLAVRRTAGSSGHANSPHPSSREGHLSTARWSSSFLLSDVIL